VLICCEQHVLGFGREVVTAEQKGVRKQQGYEHTATTAGLSCEAKA